MSWQSPLSRRALFRAAIGGGLALALHGIAGESVSQWLTAARLRELVRHDVGAIPIGTAFLLRQPVEADPRRLVGELLASLPRHTVPPHVLGRRSLEALVRDGIRADFQAGRTVALHGWIVSVTEARLAALVIAT